MVELIGIVSAHSPNVIEAATPVSAGAVQRYADRSHLRIRHWLAVLDDLPREIVALPPALRPLLWERAEITLVDVLAGGLVARVWGAVLTACDRSRRTVAAEKVARDVLAGQMQAQQQVLQMLVDGPHLPLECAVELDRLRRHIERWTDLLLGHLVRRYALADFAYDLERALDFGDEQVRESWGTRRIPIWDLYFLCLNSGFPRSGLPGGVHGIWREELIESILGCFTPEMFHSDGPLMSVRLRRLMSSGARRECPSGPGRLPGPRFASCRGRKGKRLIDEKPRSGGDCSGVTP
ncbi:MAG: hypothetical protein ACM3U2_18290 [Deltaproteobacteria bacterium]